MLQRRLFCLSFYLLIICTVHAQVNLQTGSATFSLPMFNWQDTKSRLNTVVALSYSSGSGLKVNEVASNVGQGWNLVAGGVITRMQVGEPDDQKGFNGNGTEKDITKYPNGYLYTLNTSFPPGKGCPEALTRYPIYGSANQVYKQHNSVAADRQLDYFSFQFNGKAGMFVLSTDGGVDHGVMLGDSKMQITFQRDENLTVQGVSPRTTITSFTIRDVDGLIYKFSVKGITKVLENNYCDEKLNQQLTQPTMGEGGIYHQAGFENTSFVKPWVVGSWYLTEIEDAFTGRKIFFNYGDTRNINSVAGEDVSYDQWHKYVIIAHKTSKSKTPVLTSIATPDGHNVAFEFGKDRVDFTGEKALTKVDITYQGRYLSRYQLNSTYFILNRYGTPVSEYQRRVARLCLRSVKKIGVDLKEDSPPYIFDYYTGSNNADDFVPPPFFYAHDVWGYYNGNNSKAYLNSGIQEIPLNKTISQLDHNSLKGLCFIKEGVTGIVLNPKDGYAKNGLLRQIIYPTGGTLTYEYQQNRGTFMNYSTESTVGGVHVSKTSSTDGGYSNGCTNPITTQYQYVMNGPGSASSIWGLEKPVNTFESGMHYAAEYKVYKWKWSSPLGYCDYKYKFPGILSLNQSVGLTEFQQLMKTWEPVLGILSLVSTVMDVVNVVCGASGFMAWAAVVVDIVGGLITLGVSCLSNNTKDGTSTICYNFDLNAASPLPAQFKRVEVIEGTGGIGKTVQEFTSSDDYPLWVPDNPNYAARQRFAPWAYGLPKFTTVFDKDDNKIRQIENVYDFYNAQGIVDEICWHCPPPDNGVWSTLVSCKCEVKKSSSQRNVDWTDPNFYDGEDKYTITSIPDMDVELYPMYSGRVELLRTNERVFKTTDQNQYVETVTNYQYNFGTPNYDVNSISTTQSNGDTYYKYISYSGNYTGGTFDVMNAQNMVSVPVVTREQVSNANGGLSGYVTEKVTEFTQLGNGDIKPLRTLEERTDKPNSSWTFYNGPNSTDYSKFKVTQAFTYDAAGNLISAKDEGNRVITNIYGYSDKYVIASVINADPVVDKPTYSSFEVEGANGGWQLTGNAATRVAGGTTGDWAFNLNGNSFSATLNTAKPYLLSFWANNGNVVVTGGATLKVSAPTINGFTYYQYDIAAGTASVTIDGNAYIDELRLYPSTARMRSITYDPLIGKTSECDENNRITYYEYDNLARLRFIKDENRNIVKMYEYNNVSKQNGCPGIYYNHAIVENFTKSNCGSGFLPAEVPYSVPANKYSSTISQEDADAQAETEILTYGQANADNASAASNCKLLYYNTQQSKGFTTETCSTGYEGGTVTYTVPANKYFTTIDQATANQMAMEEVDANGQAHANDPAFAVCNLDTNAVWEWSEGDSSYCVNINGQLPAHLFVKVTNVNPNSPGFGGTQWKDAGPSDLCPSNLYYNTDQSGNYYSQVCTGGQPPNPYPVRVPPGTFSSTISVQDADNLARQDAQTKANQNGTCGLPTIPVYYANDLGGPITIEFWDAVNLKRYTLIAYGHENGTLGEIPEGAYTITITLPNSPGGYFYVEGCGWSQEGPSPMTFGTFYIGSGCNLISIY